MFLLVDSPLEESSLILFFFILFFIILFFIILLFNMTALALVTVARTRLIASITPMTIKVIVLLPPLQHKMTELTLKVILRVDA